MIFFPNTMTDTHSCSYHCTEPACIAAQRDELRDKYFALYLHYEAQQEVAPVTVAAFKQRLVEAIEAMPFGDTGRSFASFVRDFK